MNKTITIIAFAFLSLLKTEAQQFNYVKKIAGEKNDRCHDVVSDQGNYIYVCGSFEGTLGIANALSLTATAFNSDAFVTKLDARSGKAIWARQGSGVANDVANAMAIDKNGNLYVTGVFTANTKFENTTVSGSGYENLFLAKFNPQGGLIWLKMAGGAAQTRAVPRDIKVGDDGKLYITGSMRGSITFGSITANSSNSNVSTADVFIAKYDTSGTALWVSNYGKSGLTEGFGIETDKNGNIYVAGSQSDTLIVGTDTLIGNNNNFMFVLALDKNGKGRWLRRHSNSWGSAYAIKLNAKGQLYVVGESNQNGFLMEVDTTSGNSKWFKQTSGGYTSSKAMAIDSRGNIYVTGGVHYGGTFDNILIKTECACSNNGADMFTARYNDTGKVIWVQQGGGGLFDDIGYGIDLDRKGDAYVAGIYASDGKFGPFTLTGFNGQQTEGFAAKINTGLIYGKPLTTNICTNHGTIPFIYTLNSRMTDGNKIKFEMSDTGGIFNQATLLEVSDTSKGSDTIQLPMPNNKMALKAYQLRITTTAPADTFYLADGLIFQPKPKSYFTVDDSLQCISNNVFKFTNLSTGPPLSTLNYMWNLDDGTLAAVKNLNPYTYNKAGIYTAKLETITNRQCKDTFFKNIIVQGKPVISFTINDSTQCLKNNLFSFANTSTINDNSPLKLNWNFGDGKTDSITNPAHSYAGTGLYNVRLKATSTAGCIDSAIRKVQIEEANIEREKFDAHCAGKTGMISPRNSSQTYQWLRNDTLLQTTAKFLFVTGSGIYKFIAITASGCRDTSAGDTFKFYGKPLKPHVMKSVDTVYVNDIYSRYQWYRDGQLLSNDTNFRILQAPEGKYHVKVWNSQGCDELSDTLLLRFDAINDTRFIQTLIYPNPGNGLYNFTIDSDFSKMEVLSVLGQTLLAIEPGSGQIDIRHLPAGLYFVRIQTAEDQVYMVRLLKN